MKNLLLLDSCFSGRDICTSQANTSHKSSHLTGKNSKRTFALAKVYKRQCNHQGLGMRAS